MPKEVIKGSGITKRVVTVYGGDLGEDDFLESLKDESYACDFDSAIAKVERWAVEVLERARAEKRRVDVDDDSDESYALRFQHNIGIVRTLIKKKDADKAALFALTLGDLIGEARLKFRAERTALLGLSRSKDAAGGGIERAKQKKSEAAAWQSPIFPTVKRLLKAGKTDSDIAGKTYNSVRDRPGAGPKPKLGTLKKYIATVRKAEQKK